VRKKSERDGHEVPEEGQKETDSAGANLAGSTTSPCCPSSKPYSPMLGWRDFPSGAVALGEGLRGHLGGKAATQSLTHPEDERISSGLNMPGTRNCRLYTTQGLWRGVGVMTVGSDFLKQTEIPLGCRAPYTRSQHSTCC
jgi:hypothetical protein